MINTWWVTRPKRKLNSVPEVLATLSEVSLNQEWEGQRDTHLTLEEALEEAHLKRRGERRDQTGGGARTYGAWISSLGLVFIQESTRKLKLTLAGEAIMNGDSPVEILKNQVLKYQFPSSFSLSRGVNVAPRFRIHPFRFLLKLLMDRRIAYLTEEEIAKVVITQAENETDRCYESVVQKILLFREAGDASLEQDFNRRYAPKTGKVNPDHPYSHLTDTANTFINWIEFTQLAVRDGNRSLRVIPEKINEITEILNSPSVFIDRPDEHEYFQRKYGLDPKHTKDTRNLLGTRTITASIIAEQQIKKAFISESLKSPITRITVPLVGKIADLTGIDGKFVEETLCRLFPHGAIGAFMAEYFEMAFHGRDDAIEFEKATTRLFEEVFGFESKHIGSKGLTPDVLIISDDCGFCGILDNKAYSDYSISNDHHNRMVHNYIEGFARYCDSRNPLAFFSYIAGGFCRTIDSQIVRIVEATGVHGSAISVSSVIKMVENQQAHPYSHTGIKDILSLDRQVRLSDL